MKDDSLVINVRLPKKLVDKIDKQMDVQRRPTRTNMIQILIEDALAAIERSKR